MAPETAGSAGQDRVTDSAATISLRRRTCECGHSHPTFRCRHYQTPHEPHYWPARASDTTFYCDGGGETRDV